MTPALANIPTSRGVKPAQYAQYSKQATLAAYSAYELPRVAALIRYFNTAAGYPLQSIWLKAIGAGN